MVRESQWKKFSDCPVPVNAHLNPDRHFGAIPSKMSQRIKTFMKEYTEKDGRSVCFTYLVLPTYLCLSACLPTSVCLNGTPASLVSVLQTNDNTSRKIREPCPF